MLGRAGFRRVSSRGDDMENIEFVSDLYEAFQRGDLPYIIQRFGDLQNSGVLADAERRAPWHFPMNGPGAVAKYFEALMGALEPIRLDARDFAAVGDCVYATLSQ